VGRGFTVEQSHLRARPEYGLPRTSALTDTELGPQYGFIHQTAHAPQYRQLTMLELPTGNADKA